MAKQYWIFKTEPSTYSIDDLAREGQTEWWGIRNYQVRNFLRDSMQKEDMVLLYHSSAKIVGVVGLGKIVSDAYPDTEQFKNKSHYYDAKSTKEHPTWIARDILFQEKFSQIVTLDELRNDPNLKNLLILRPGNRLSITPVSQKEYQRILTLARKK